MTDYTKKITPEYCKQHAVCPECGNGVGTALFNYIYEPDRNSCWCNCGWRGICHDLVPDLAAGER